MSSYNELLRKHSLVLIFTTLYVAFFTWYIITYSNAEFLLYLAVVYFFILLVFVTLPKTQLPGLVIWGLSIWGFLHLAGGNLIVGGDVLYNWVMISLFEIKGEPILKFDQFVHWFGFGAATHMSFCLLQNHFAEKNLRGSVLFFSVLMGMGLGALNELVEFIATVFIADTNVGGYVNTGLDLVFNLLGCLTAVVILRFIYEA